MESYYEFNVAFNGSHLFATAPRSFPTCRPDHATVFLAILREKFPEEEGYRISVTRWDCVGHHCTENVSEGLK